MKSPSDCATDHGEVVLTRRKSLYLPIFPPSDAHLVGITHLLQMGSSSASIHERCEHLEEDGQNWEITCFNRKQFSLETKTLLLISNLFTYA